MHNISGVSKRLQPTLTQGIAYPTLQQGFKVLVSLRTERTPVEDYTTNMVSLFCVVAKISC